MFYGWVIVGVTLLAQFIALGTAFYSFGPLLKPLEDELGASRTQISFAMSLLTATGLAGGPLAGWLADRGSIRRVMLAGAASFSVGALALALAHVQSVAQLWLVYAGPIALGMALLGGVPNARLISSWFERRRGLALGIAMLGVSLAGVLVQPAMSALVASFGWRAAVRALALMPVLFAPLLWLVSDEPAARGLHPDGLPQAPRGPALGARDPGFRSVLANPATWLVALCFALLFAPNGGIVVQIYEHARDLGLQGHALSLAITAMAVGGGIGKPVYGLLADRWGSRRSIALALGMMILGLVLFLRASGAPSLMAAGGAFGLGFAGLMPLHVVLAGEIFGREVLGRVLGTIGILMAPFTIGVHPLMGWIHDSTGSYALAFQIFIGGCVVSGALLLLIPAAPEARSETVPAA